VQPDFGAEVVGFSRAEMVAAAHVPDDRVDDWEIGQEERFLHRLRRGGVVAQRPFGAGMVHVAGHLIR